MDRQLLRHLVRGRHHTGWTSAEVLGTLLGGMVLLGGFLAWENRVATPMVPLQLFRGRAFAIGNLTMFFMSGATFAAAFLVTQSSTINCFALTARAPEGAASPEAVDVLVDA